MSKQAADTSTRVALASADDIRRVLGPLDGEKVIAIMALRPTTRDVEEALVWLAGDADVFDAGEPLKTNAGRIVEILTADEEEEPRSQA
jgi:hypothetical protein